MSHLVPPLSAPRAGATAKKIVHHHSIYCRSSAIAAIPIYRYITFDFNFLSKEWKLFNLVHSMHWTKWVMKIVIRVTLVLYALSPHLAALHLAPYTMTAFCSHLCGRVCVCEKVFRDHCIYSTNDNVCSHSFSAHNVPYVCDVRCDAAEIAHGYVGIIIITREHIRGQIHPKQSQLYIVTCLGWCMDATSLYYFHTMHTNY